MRAARRRVAPSCNRLRWQAPWRPSGLGSKWPHSLFDSILLSNSVGLDMATVNVRRLDEEVVSRLKRRASANNRSLESEVRHILEDTAADHRTPGRDAFRQLASGLRDRTAGTP